jgi:excisionase family DNA binding protein
VTLPHTGGMETIDRGTDLPDPLTPQQAADFHRVDVKTIYRWLDSGLIKGYKIGPKLIRLRRDSVLNLGQPMGGGE